MKRLAVLLLALMAVVTPAPAFAADSAVVFMYHRFGESDYPSTNITIAQFEAHLEELTKGGYKVLPVPDILAALRRGAPLPDRTVGLTIDDAFLSVYKQAWPRLKAAGFPFTLFVSTDTVDRGSKVYMTWDQIREMADAGVVIGGHSASHLHMPIASDAGNRRELERAGVRFIDELGHVPRLFAYPYGEASLAAAEEVRKAGFIAAFGQHSGAFDATSDFLYLPRFALNEKYGDVTRFRLLANTLALPVTDVTPVDTLIGANNPPDYGFSVTASIKGLSQMTCYASHVGKVRLERLGETRFEIRIDKPFPKGRSRINCTFPSASGRWYWLGRQFYVPE